METPTFRSVNGTRFTKQLFLEMWETLPIALRTREPIYTLMHPRRGLPCFRHIYVELADPTGYELASRYLEDYNHWELLLGSSWFVEAKATWDRELDAKLTSEGMRVIRSFAAGSEDIAAPVQLAAAKYLSDKAFRPKVAKAGVRGRPSKEEIEGNLRNEASSAKDIAADLARIRRGA